MYSSCGFVVNMSGACFEQVGDCSVASTFSKLGFLKFGALTRYWYGGGNQVLLVVGFIFIKCTL